MQNLFQTFLDQSIQRYQNLNEGSLATYIPELGQVDPKLFSLAIVDVEGRSYSAGHTEARFTLQSTSKPFSYGLLLGLIGQDSMRKIVGVEPTGEAFNSIIELEKNTHRPYNPMINSGAIAVCAHLQECAKVEAINHILKHYQAMANKDLTIDEAVFQSEKKTAHRNRAIAHLLRHFEIIGDQIDESLDLYFKQCSIKADILALATMGATLANGGTNPISSKKVIEPLIARDTLSLMFTCGMYDTSGEWAYQVGLPAKSGVSGALIAIVPGKLAIACYSPLINKHGHSERGLRVIKDFVDQFNFNLFNGKSL